VYIYVNLTAFNNYEDFNNSTSLTAACQVRQRIYKGIPDSLRGRVWSLLLGIDRMKLEQVGVYEVSSVCVRIIYTLILFQQGT